MCMEYKQAHFRLNYVSLLATGDKLDDFNWFNHLNLDFLLQRSYFNTPREQYSHVV